MDCLSRILTLASRTSFIHGLSVGNDSLQIHHLLFADDTILITYHEEAIVQNLFNLEGFFMKLQVWTWIGKTLRFWALIVMNSGWSTLLTDLDVSWNLGLLHTSGSLFMANQHLFLSGNLSSTRSIKDYTHGSTIIHLKEVFMLLKVTLSNFPRYYLSLFYLPTKVASIIESLFKRYPGSGSTNMFLITSIGKQWNTHLKMVVWAHMITKFATFPYLPNENGSFMWKKMLCGERSFWAHMGLVTITRNYLLIRLPQPRAHGFTSANTANSFTIIFISSLRREGDIILARFVDWRKPIKSTYPRLLVITETKHFSIKEVWDDSNVIWNLRFSVEISRMMKSVTGFPPLNTPYIPPLIEEEPLDKEPW